MARSWRPAYSLDVLSDEIDDVAPRRSTRSDGTIGDQAHANRDSDHNPNAVGVVRAKDFTHDPDGGLDCNVLAEFLAARLGKHPALGPGAYLIWRGRIISTSRLSEGWRRYTGANKHNQHIHVSTGRYGYDDRTAFGLGAPAIVKPYVGQAGPKTHDGFERIYVTEMLRNGLDKGLKKTRAGLWRDVILPGRTALTPKVLKALDADLAEKRRKTPASWRIQAEALDARRRYIANLMKG